MRKLCPIIEPTYNGRLNAKLLIRWQVNWGHMFLSWNLFRSLCHSCYHGHIEILFQLLCVVRASKTLFEALCHAVLQTPLRWLDKVPVGRMLNLFTADFSIVDSRLAHDFSFFLYQALRQLRIMVASFFESSFMILFTATLLCVAVLVAQRYLGGAREVKRIKSNAKSPFFEQFGSALAGVSTIRAFDKLNKTSTGT